MFDATHGSSQTTPPRFTTRFATTSTDVHVVMSELARKMRARFCDVYDVMLARRHVPVEEPQSGRLGCLILGLAAEPMRLQIAAAIAKAAEASVTKDPRHRLSQRG